MNALMSLRKGTCVIFRCQPFCSFYPVYFPGTLTYLVKMSPGRISLSGQMYLMIIMAVTYQVPTTLRKLPRSRHRVPSPQHQPRLVQLHPQKCPSLL